MLIIRAAQEQVFERRAQRLFEDDLGALVSRRFPVDAELLGEPGLRRVVAFGMERASRRGLSIRGDVAGYVCLMFVLGSRFDEDPQLPWARRALSASPGRLGTLLADAAGHVRRTAGPKGEAYTRVLLRVLHTPWPGFRAEPPGPGSGASTPPRWRRFGPHAFALVRQLGRELAGRHGLDIGHGAALCAGLMLALGTGFATDPLQPWVEPLTREPLGAPPGDARTRDLYAAVSAQIERGLAARRRRGS